MRCRAGFTVVSGDLNDPTSTNQTLTGFYSRKPVAIDLGMRGIRCAIVEAKGLTKAGGDELAEVVDRALEGNPDIVEKLKADPGDKSIGAIVGAVMR